MRHILKVGGLLVSSSWDPGQPSPSSDVTWCKPNTQWPCQPSRDSMSGWVTSQSSAEPVTSRTSSTDLLRAAAPKRRVLIKGKNHQHTTEGSPCNLLSAVFLTAPRFSVLLVCLLVCFLTTVTWRGHSSNSNNATTTSAASIWTVSKLTILLRSVCQRLTGPANTNKKNPPVNCKLTATAWEELDSRVPLTATILSQHNVQNWGGTLMWPFQSPGLKDTSGDVDKYRSKRRRRKGPQLTMNDSQHVAWARRSCLVRTGLQHDTQRLRPREAKFARNWTASFGLSLFESSPRYTEAKQILTVKMSWCGIFCDKDTQSK